MLTTSGSARYGALIMACSAWALAACTSVVSPDPMTISDPPLPPTHTSIMNTPSASDLAKEPSSSVSPHAREQSTTEGQPCGPVSSAAGLSLEITHWPPEMTCVAANGVIAEFHRKIAGRQVAHSTHAVGEHLDQWWCVSGPPASQGGTSCDQHGKLVLAVVVTGE